MPDTTDNHSLRYPLDTDSIDTAGDIQRLAEDVDGGLSIDVDADGRTDFGTTGPPLRLHGAGRPDGKGGFDLIEAPLGSTYTWTGDDQDAVWGARIWSKHPLGMWVCDVGISPRVQYGNNYTLILQRVGPLIVCRVYGDAAWDGTNTGVSTDAGWKCMTATYGLLYCSNRGSQMPYLSIGNGGDLKVGNGPADPQAMAGALTAVQGLSGDYAWPEGVPNSGWQITSNPYFASPEEMEEMSKHG